MPRSKAHPRTLFSLIPLNDRAMAVLASHDHLASLIDGKIGLGIGQTPSISGEVSNLATLGRNGDIQLQCSSISKIQCSFEIDMITKVVMFYDRSHNQTSQVYGPDANPFEYGRPRKVVVQNNTNTMIGLGGVNRNLFEFQLFWHYEPADVLKMTESRGSTQDGYEQNPRLAQTVDETDTVLPSQCQTRPPTRGPQQSKLRCAHIEKVGSGKFGSVFKVVDVDSGRLMAVKILNRLRTSDPKLRTQQLNALKQEAVNLAKFNHPHIVDYIASRGWGENNPELFMGLKEGTLQSLVINVPSVPVEDLAWTVFRHMLQAIDFLAVQNFVHRDIKPENILYVFRQGQYQFQLGDFGLSQRQTIAKSIEEAQIAGTIPYMAPEVFRGVQTHKADVWALFVTMMWTFDVNEFRRAEIKTPESAEAAVLSAASYYRFALIREMARPDPNERASAAQLLVKINNGQGLSTSSNLIPPLSEPAQLESETRACPPNTLET